MLPGSLFSRVLRVVVKTFPPTFKLTHLYGVGTRGAGGPLPLADTSFDGLPGVGLDDELLL